MKRLVTLAALVVAAAVPAVVGLVGNPSFGADVPVRIPAGAIVAGSTHPESHSRAGRRPRRRPHHQRRRQRPSRIDGRQRADHSNDAGFIVRFEDGVLGADDRHQGPGDDHQPIDGVDSRRSRGCHHPLGAG